MNHVTTSALSKEFEKIAISEQGKRDIAAALLPAGVAMLGSGTAAAVSPFIREAVEKNLGREGVARIAKKPYIAGGAAAGALGIGALAVNAALRHQIDQEKKRIKAGIPYKDAFQKKQAMDPDARSKAYEAVGLSEPVAAAVRKADPYFAEFGVSKDKSITQPWQLPGVREVMEAEAKKRYGSADAIGLPKKASAVDVFKLVALRSLGGGAVGAGGGAVLGAVSAARASDKEDRPEAARKGALRGAAIGGVAGALGGGAGSVGAMRRRAADLGLRPNFPSKPDILRGYARDLVQKGRTSVKPVRDYFGIAGRLVSEPVKAYPRVMGPGGVGSDLAAGALFVGGGTLPFLYGREAAREVKEGK